MESRQPGCYTSAILTTAVAGLGSRSLPQSLGGGDLDGDLYNLIQYQDLFPKQTVKPAAYDPTVLQQLPEGQRCTIDHLADFVIDFINNDRLGVISQMVRPSKLRTPKRGQFTSPLLVFRT
jgi:hypothetical protein